MAEEVIDLDAQRPHMMVWQICLKCLQIERAIIPLEEDDDPPILYECSACHQLACINIKPVRLTDEILSAV